MRFLLFYQRLELGAGTTQAASHRRGPTLRDLGDLLGRIPFHIVQMHHRAILGRKGVENPPHLVRHQRGRCRGRFGKQRFIIGKRLGPMARRGTAKLVAPVDGHADEPCLEVFVVLEHSCVLQQADKRFLAHIACVGGLARLAERETIHHVLPIAQGMVHEFVRAQISHGFQSPPYPKHADAMENVAKFLKPYSTPPKAKHTGMRSAWDEGAKSTARPGAFGAGCIVALPRNSQHL